MLPDGRCVINCLTGSGFYLNQFETGISSGGLTAYSGGERDAWEQKLFGGVYQATHVLPEWRPKYGGLNVFGNPIGACPRFGSSFLRLKPQFNDVSTFSYGDSVTDPEHVGTSHRFLPVLVGILHDLSVSGSALGWDGGVGSFCEWVMRGTTSPDQIRFRVLDEYIEAQVHGRISLATDVEALALDPSFQGTDIEAAALEATRTFGFDLEWTPGSVISVEDLPLQEDDSLADAYRWRQFRATGQARRLAEEVTARFGASDRVLNPYLIGLAAADGVRMGDRWVAWGNEAAVQTALKDLWLALVFYGHNSR